MRIRRYLHPSTLERVELECQLWLVCDENLDFINDSCSEIIQREQWTGISSIFVAVVEFFPLVSWTLPLPWGIAVFSLYHLAFSVYFVVSCLQRFDAVGWAAGRASGLQKTECWGAGIELGADLHIAQLTHCNSLSLASVKSRLVLHFWYHLTRVVLDKGPLNVCVCVCGFTLLPAFECTLN